MAMVVSRLSAHITLYSSLVLRPFLTGGFTAIPSCTIGLCLSKRNIGNERLSSLDNVLL